MWKLNTVFYRTISFMEVSVFEVTLQSVNFKMTEHINSKDVGYLKSENMAPHMRAQTHTHVILYLKYIVQNLPHWQRSIFCTVVVGGNGWKNPKVLASRLWRGCLVCMTTSHSAQNKGRGRQSRQRTTAKLLQHCWHFRVPTFSCASAVLTRRGLAAFQLSEELLFLVLQFNEAEREACGVGDSTPSPVASLSDCWRSRRNPSVKIVQKSPFFI